MAACTGLALTFSTATTVSPETLKFAVVPGLVPVPLAARIMAFSIVPTGLPPGWGIGVATGRKVSPQPASMARQTTPPAALFKTAALRLLNKRTFEPLLKSVLPDI